MLGARTNRKSPINSIYAAYTGCLPKYSSRLDENRAAKCVVEPDTTFGRTYNSTIYGNLLWDINQTFRIAFEVTYRRTEYKDPAFTGRLPNDGFGFHTQFQ